MFVFVYESLLIRFYKFSLRDTDSHTVVLYIVKLLKIGTPKNNIIEQFIFLQYSHVFNTCKPGGMVNIVDPVQTAPAI